MKICKLKIWLDSNPAYLLRYVNGKNQNGEYDQSMIEAYLLRYVYGLNQNGEYDQCMIEAYSVKVCIRNKSKWRI